MIGYKNRQRTNDSHIIGVLEERTKNATELVFKIKDMNLLIQKSPTGSKMAHKNLHNETRSDTVWSNQEKTFCSQLLPWEGKRKVERVSNIPAFWEVAQGTIFCLT